MEKKPEQWISVKDILPEKMGLYLVFNREDPDRMVQYLIDVKWYHPDAPFNKFVTHYMPLPEPPALDSDTLNPVTK